MKRLIAVLLAVIFTVSTAAIVYAEYAKECNKTCCAKECNKTCCAAEGEKGGCQKADPNSK